MTTMNCLCAYCREANKTFTGLDIPDALWLEELGEMIETAVQSLGHGHPVASGCNGLRTAA